MFHQIMSNLPHFKSISHEGRAPIPRTILGGAQRPGPVGDGDNRQEQELQCVTTTRINEGMEEST